MSIAIDQAFTAAMLGGGLGIDLVHENGAYSLWNGASYTTQTGVYTPQARREFAEMRHFPASRSAASLAHTDEHLGLYQVILKFPADTADMTAKLKAEAVIAILKPAALLTYNGQSVEIISASRSAGVVNSGFYELMVRANYRAFVAR